MKLKTSFFNPTILKKDITRFAPVWGIYGVLTILVVMLLWDGSEIPAHIANSASEIFMGMGIVNFLYAPLAAFMLFGDLFKSRMCNALHALPMRREGWFLTHFTAGMLFCVVPNGVAALLTAMALQRYAWMAFLWLALMILQYLFFFGAAVFAIQCAGNLLGAVAVYGIINFLAVMVGALAILFYEPLLYGIKMDIANFAKFSPVVRFTDSDYLNTHYDNMTEMTILDGFVGADWGYLGIAAGVGLVFLGLAVLLYRRRQLESAGDLIAFLPAAPVFSVIYTLCVGALLYLVANSITGFGYGFLFVGLALGFFTGRMLLERKVNVFRGKNFAVFGILVAVFVATFGITALDPVGITRYVPEEGQISSVQICTSHYYYDMRHDTISLTDQADIAAIKKIHEDCLDTRYTDRYDRVPLYIRYNLKNGTTVDRYYYLKQDSPAVNTLNGYYSTVKAVFGGVEPAYVQRNLRYMEVYAYDKDRPITAIGTSSDYLDLEFYLEKYGDETGKNPNFYLTDTPEDDPILTGLFAAMEADCLAGKMAQSGPLQDSEVYANLVIGYLSVDYRSLDISIYSDCENTVAFLKSLDPEDAVPEVTAPNEA